MFHLFTDVVENTPPEVVGALSEFLNSTFAQISAIGVSGLASISLLLSKIIPTKNFSQNISDKYYELKAMVEKETNKLDELTNAQKAYQEANDALLIEIAQHSPNKKIKELGEKLGEKKKELNIQENIQDRVQEQVAKVVKVLKEKA
jgi:hypothetical protein